MSILLNFAFESYCSIREKYSKDNVYDTMSTLNTPQKLLNYMEDFEYGFISNGKIEEYNFKKYKFNTPESVFNNKVGVCWDQASFAFYVFKKYIKKPCNLFFISQDNDMYCTHLFLIFKDNGKYYYFENSYASQRGVHEFSSEQDIINFVINNMRSQYSDNGIRVYKVNRLPKYGVGVNEFVDRIEAGNKLIYTN